MTGRAKDSEPAKTEAPAEPQSGFVKVPAEAKADPDTSTAKPWGGQSDVPAPEQSAKADPPKAPPKTDRT